MKNVVTFIGVLIAIVALFNIGKYISDFQELSSYGKGFVTGNILILMLGASFIYWGAFRKKREN